MYTNVGDCPDGWTAVVGKCFQVKSPPKSWSDASSSCRSINGKLAEISSSIINNWISQKVRGVKGIWFAATDAKVEGKWTNEDGTALTPFF